MEPPGIPGRFSLSVESGPCPRLGVDRVGLAPLTSHGPIRAIDLDHFDARCGQVAGEAGTIGACAFDTYSSKLAEAAHPGQEVAITLGACRELGRLEDPASIVDHGAHVDIFMGVHPADDNLLCFCHAWSCLPLMPMGEAPPAGTDRTLMVLVKAPIRSRPSDRLCTSRAEPGRQISSKAQGQSHT